MKVWFQKGGRGCLTDDILIAYGDGTLESVDMERVEAHRARCPACALRAGEFLKVCRAVAHPLPSPSADPLALAIEQSRRERCGTSPTRPSSAPFGRHRSGYPATPLASRRALRGTAGLIGAALLGGVSGYWAAQPRPDGASSHPIPVEQTRSIREAPAPAPAPPPTVPAPSTRSFLRTTDAGPFPPDFPLERRTLECNLEGMYLRDLLRSLFTAYGDRVKPTLRRSGKRIGELSDRELGFVLDPRIGKAYLSRLTLPPLPFHRFLTQVVGASRHCRVLRGGKWKRIPHPSIRYYERNGIYYFVPED